MTNRIVIEVGGGASCEVYCDDPSVEVVLLDWDTGGFEAGDHYIHEVGDGTLVLAVPGYPTTRPDRMPADTRSALDRAGIPRPMLTPATQEDE